VQARQKIKNGREAWEDKSRERSVRTRRALETGEEAQGSNCKQENRLRTCRGEKGRGEEKGSSEASQVEEEDCYSTKGMIPTPHWVDEVQWVRVPLQHPTPL
jgi:hypothetical protein